MSSSANFPEPAAIDPPELCGSLATCLPSIFAEHGVEVSAREVAALLGLLTRPGAVAGECPSRWWRYRQDRALPAAAGLFGWGIRELHPPAVARGLETSAEFPLHFRDSYLPLVRTALAHGQAVLAWRGWPAPADLAWGRILRVDADDATFGCAGEKPPDQSSADTASAGGASAAIVRLVGPPHQVYVCEGRIGPGRQPSADERFDVAVGAAREASRNADAVPNPASRCIVCGRATGTCLAELEVAHARRHAILAGWLDELLGALTGGRRDAADAWARRGGVPRPPEKS